MLLSKALENNIRNIALDSFAKDFSLFEDPFYPLSKSAEFKPSIDIKETEKGYNIYLEAPGMDKADFKVEAENNVLRISGEKKESRSEENEKFCRSEITYGRFDRSIKFNDIDSDAVEAEYKDGILKVTVPKAVKALPKSISIK